MEIYDEIIFAGICVTAVIVFVKHKLRHHKAMIIMFVLQKMKNVDYKLEIS